MKFCKASHPEVIHNEEKCPVCDVRAEFHDKLFEVDRSLVDVRLDVLYWKERAERFEAFIQKSVAEEEKVDASI